MTTLIKEPEIVTAKVVNELTLPRPEFINTIERVFDEMGAHMGEYEIEKIREMARTASRVTFGIWGRKPGCPLEQTGLCTNSNKVDSVFELFVKWFDIEMRKAWGLDDGALGTVTIL